MSFWTFQACIPSIDEYSYPLFVFQDGHSQTDSRENESPARDRVLKVSYVDSKGRAKPMKDSDDFVFLE